MITSAGMQPYFFPYLGYFDLIYNVDQWVIFDTPQYINEGWVNRNRILHPESGWRYIVVPVKKHSLRTPINEIRICHDGKWQVKMLRHLHHYKKYAPHYEAVYSLVEDCLSHETELLSQLNVSILEKVCRYLGIPFDYLLFSESNLDLEISKSSDWAIQITRTLGASVLVNPPGGRHLYDPQEFRQNGIELIIREFPTFDYPTPGYTFEPNLSIIDVLMWNTPEQVREYLDRVKLSG